MTDQADDAVLGPLWERLNPGSLLAALVGSTIIATVSAAARSLDERAFIVVVGGVAALVIGGLLFRLARPYWELRFANLIWILDDQMNAVFITHPKYGKLQPPGGRLKITEGPEEAVERVLLAEVGWSADREGLRLDPDLHPRVTQPGDPNVLVLTTPFKMQLERGEPFHRGFVRNHLDFLYVYRTPGIRPALGETDHIPRWCSLSEVQGWEEGTTHRDIKFTYREIVERLERSNQRS